jgi:hypothetical protein
MRLSLHDSTEKKAQRSKIIIDCRYHQIYLVRFVEEEANADQAEDVGETQEGLEDLG